jgi:hypothetical protein
LKRAKRTWIRGRAKGKRGSVICFRTNASRPTHKGVRCGDDFCLTWQLNQLLRSPFHSQRSYKIKKSYSDLRFYQGKRHRKSGMPHPSNTFRLTCDARGRNHTNWLQNRLGIGFPNAYCVYAKGISSDQATFIGAISSCGSLREYVPCPSADSSWKPAIVDDSTWVSSLLPN